MMRKSSLTVLGCGDAFASGGRFCTSFYIASQAGGLLLDCGASTLIRLKQLGISTEAVDTIVITHFHGDHYGGLPFLFLSMRFEGGRQKPLTVIGPAGLKDRVYQLQEALYPETSYVIDELPVTFEELGDKWKGIDGYEVQAFPVTHSPASNPHGVRLRWNGEILGFSGDTEWDDNLLRIADNTKLMICECNLCDEPAPGHLHYGTVIEKAPLMKTERLLLTHLGPAMLGKETAFEKLQDGQVLELW